MLWVRTLEFRFLFHKSNVDILQSYHRGKQLGRPEIYKEGSGIFSWVEVIGVIASEMHLQIVTGSSQWIGA